MTSINDAVTFGRVTFSLMTIGPLILNTQKNVTLSVAILIAMLNVIMHCHYTERHYAECL